MTETVVLTGITGFLAKHVALRLLNAGYRVRGTVRRLDRGEEVRAAVAPALVERARLNKLEFVQADLESDAGWAAAMAGAAAVVHTASPFPMTSPKDPMVLIRPAVEGTRRVLAAAHRAGVRRVVLTSSVAAIITPRATRVLDETDWPDPDDPHLTPYARSKALAERAAWDFVAGEGQGMQLPTVNPGMIAGPPLDRHYGDSIRLVRRVLRGKDPLLPDFALSWVDVRDVAEVHLRLLQRPHTAGRRFIATAQTLSLPQVARVLKQAHPERRIPTGTAPDLAIRALALFDPSLRDILHELGWRVRLSAARAEQELDMRFISAEGALRATADWLIRAGEV